MTPYKTETTTQGGNTYLVEWFYDADSIAPWECEDGHGIVSDWTTRDKRPGELVLTSDRGRKRFYDYAASIEIAKRDGWGIAGQTFKSKGEQAAAAVDADYKRLSDWCNDEWHYYGIRVTLLDSDSNKTAHWASLWGLESDCAEHHREVIADLIMHAEKERAEFVHALLRWRTSP